MLRPDVETDSAGTYAYHKVVDLTRRYAVKEGADIFLKRIPEDLATKNLCDYDLIIAMEPEHEQAVLKQSPECANKVEVWHIEDPYKLPYKQAQQTFENIKTKVTQLAKNL
jgi:protein-tyrosine-phosphatase